jgi:hypothetical protein
MENKPTPKQPGSAAIEKALDALVEVLNEQPKPDNWMEKANQRKADLSSALRKQEEVNERERAINSIKRVLADPDLEKAKAQFPSALLAETANMPNLIMLKATDLISKVKYGPHPSLAMKVLAGILVTDKTQRLVWDHEEE